MSDLLPTDLAAFAALGIDESLLAAAGVKRVSDVEARAEYGFNGSGDRAGIFFSYRDPISGRRVTGRLRLDNPELEGGKPKSKYLCPYGDRHHLYFAPGASDRLTDVETTVVIPESEKAALAITAYAGGAGVRLLAVATGGCWGWRGKKGKVETPDGKGGIETGPLPDLDLITWKSGDVPREVIICFDANAATNSKVQAARRAFAEELSARGAKVRIANVPDLPGVNGPDDLLRTSGGAALAEVLVSASLFAESARIEAQAVIDAIELEVEPVTPGAVKNLYAALAAVEDDTERRMLATRAAAVLRGIVAKAEVLAAVTRSRKFLLADRQETTERARVARLRNTIIDPVALVGTLEQFFAERAFLPAMAALVLAFFVLLTWTFEKFDTTAYLCLESATPECGKSTVMRLLQAVCARASLITSMTPAVLFRIADTERPTLLIDEAEILEGQSERAEELRAICHEGYRRGGRVARIEGEDRHIRWFAVFGPKIFAAISGVTGALLSRCIVLHMTRAPKDAPGRKSTRLRALERVAVPLRESLEAYTLQVSSRLGELYENEPDEGYWPAITDREAELWGPLLTHARMINPTAEARLLQAVQIFTQGKREIQETDDWRISRTVALRDAILARSASRAVNGLPDSDFTPGDLLEELVASEAWAAAFAKFKNDDDGRRAKAAKVGKFLRSFRVRSEHTRAGTLYSVREVLNVLSAHIPEAPEISEAQK